MNFQQTMVNIIWFLIRYFIYLYTIVLLMIKIEILFKKIITFLFYLTI